MSFIAVNVSLQTADMRTGSVLYSGETGGVVMKKLIFTCVLLAGCATVPPEVVEGNESTVIVAWNNSTQGDTGALGVADTHCAKYGKHAKYNGKPNDFQLAYDCVK